MDTSITTAIQQSLSKAYLADLGKQGVSDNQAVSKFIELEEYEGETMITGRVNLCCQFQPVDGFTPTKANIVFDIDFYFCQPAKDIKGYSWDGKKYILQYGHFSHNILWQRQIVESGDDVWMAKRMD